MGMGEWRMTSDEGQWGRGDAGTRGRGIYDSCSVSLDRRAEGEKRRARSGERKAKRKQPTLAGGPSRTEVEGRD